MGKTRSRSQRKGDRGTMLLLPTWLVLGGLLLLPLLILLGTSFHPPDDVGNPQAISNWSQFFHSGDWAHNYVQSVRPIYLRVAWRSLWLAAITTGLCLLIGYPVSFYIALIAPQRRKNLLLALAVIPFWTSFLIRISAWRIILQDRGALNALLLHLHLIYEPLRLMDTPLAVLIGLVYGELPFMILPVYASLEKLDRTLLEASSDLGASGRGTFWRVVWPLSMPGVAAGCVLVFIPGIGQFIVSDLLGGSRTMLLGNLVQNQYTSGRDKPLGAAIALELTAAVLAMLIAYAIAAKRRGMEVAL